MNRFLSIGSRYNKTTPASSNADSPQQMTVAGPPTTEDSRRFPGWRHHFTGKKVLVKNAAEEAALGGGWADGPSEWHRYKAPWRALPEHDATKWLDEWNALDLSADQRNAIRAELLETHSVFWDSLDTPNADVEAMKLAFDRIAQILFDAGLLNDHVLAKDIPAFVWDSAIAGGWWRFANETRTTMFAEPLGRYWVFRDDNRNWDMLFVAETAAWIARMLKASTVISDPAGASEKQESPQASSSIAGQSFQQQPQTLSKKISASALGQRREAALQSFLKAHEISLGKFSGAADVHKKNLNQWRYGELPEDSVMSRRIEDVLSG